MKHRGPSGTARGFVVVLLAGALLFAVLSGTVSSPSKGGPGSIASSRDAGRSTFIALLDALGFDARGFRDAPSLLPSGGLLVLPAAPETPQGPDGPDDPIPGAVRSRDLVHYRSFVERGGVLLCSIERESMREFLNDTLGLDLQGTGVEALRGFDPVEPGDAGGQQAYRMPIGAGALVVVEDEGFMANEEMEDPGQAIFAIRLVEAISPGGAILFDEYALGRWDPPGLFALTTTARRLPVLLHLIALALLALLAVAATRTFPRDPERLEVISPASRARALAGLMAREGRWSLAARLLRDGVEARLRPVLAGKGLVELGVGLAPEQVESPADLEAYALELEQAEHLALERT